MLRAKNLEKELLRDKYRKIRNAIKSRASIDRKIKDNFFKFVDVAKFKFVVGYMPIDGEFSPLSIMEEFCRSKSKVFVAPNIKDAKLLNFWLFNDCMSQDSSHYKAEHVIPVEGGILNIIGVWNSSGGFNID